MPNLHNLLSDPLLHVSREDGDVQACTLPQVLALLGAETPLGYPALAPYQAHAWHAFLVQLAALALHRAGTAEPPRDAGAWQDLLRGLTADYPSDEPWTLVVDDPARPAFLQPPVPEGTLDGFRNTIAFPDDLDVLVTAKNHDLKAERVAHPSPEHWVFALVSLQTMQGFLGVGNYGISRMNGGFASRPAVGLVWSDRPGSHFLRDVTVLLAGRQQVLSTYEFFPAAGGLALLWLEPWDGTDSLALGRLDPWYIEVCRRVRLVAAGERLLARTTGTKVARVAAKEQQGRTGDPWTPIEKKGEKALTISANGFSYRLLQGLIFGNDATYKWSLMQDKHPVDAGHGLALLTRALARGQGETNGYHERLIPVPPPAGNFLFVPVRRRQAGDIAAQRVAAAGDVWRRALRPALFALFQGGAAAMNWTHKESTAWSEPWGRRFDALVDDRFFDSLWAELAELDAGTAPGDDGLTPARRSWHEALRRAARDMLEEAIAAAPVASARRYQAIAAAEGLLGAGLYAALATIHAPHSSNEEDIHDDAT